MAPLDGDLLPGADCRNDGCRGRKRRGRRGDLRTTQDVRVVVCIEEISRGRVGRRLLQRDATRSVATKRYCLLGFTKVYKARTSARNDWPRR